MKSLLVLSATLLCAASLIFAQADANKGQIAGTVFDSNSAVVPNATVKVHNTATGLTREIRTAANGQYRAVQLDPGPYELTADAAGFAQYKLAGLTVTVGSELSVNVTMSVQAVTTSV